MSRREPGIFDEIAWERFFRIVVVVGFVTGTFVFTAAEVLPAGLSTIAIGAIGSVAVVTAIIGFLIAAASTLDHAEERAEKASDPVTEPPEELDAVDVEARTGSTASTDAEGTESEND